MKTLIALTCCLLVWSQAAFGHATLIASSPASGAVLLQTPAQITLQFSDPVRPTALRLADPSGRPLDAGPVVRDGNSLHISVPAATDERGTWRLRWRVVSADGRPTGGTLDYSIGIMTPPVSSATDSTAARTAILWAVRWLTSLCLFIVAGIALMPARRRDAPASTINAWGRGAAIAGLLLVMVSTGVRGLDLLDVPWSHLASTAPWAIALSGPQALVPGLMVLALLTGLATLQAQSPTTRATSAIACILLPGAAYAMGGTSAGTLPDWIARPLIVLHVSAAIVWVAALLSLHLLARRDPGRTPRPPLRLPAWAPASGLLLLASGGILALPHLRQPTSLLRTDYGSVLLAVLALAGLLLLAAARSRWLLATPGQAGSQPAQRRLQKGTGTELILVVGLLGVASMWPFVTPPPSPVVAQEAAGTTISLENRQIRGLVEYPAAAGPWRIRLISIDGRPIDPQRVTLILGNPAAGIAPVAYPALRQPDGRWRADLPAPSAGGQWHLSLDIAIQDFHDVSLQTDVTLPAPAPSLPKLTPH